MALSGLFFLFIWVDGPITRGAYSCISGGAYEQDFTVPVNASEIIISVSSFFAQLLLCIIASYSITFHISGR